MVMFKSLFVNLSLIIAKFIGGFLFRSAGLIADAVHSFSDFLSDVMIIIGLRHSNKPPDSEHPIGHGKIEYILSLFLGVSILFMAYRLTVSLIAGLGEAPMVPRLAAIFVSLGVITVKLVLARYITVKAVELESQALSASGRESYADVLGSVIVIIGIVIGVIGDNYDLPLLVYGDTAAAFIIVTLVIRVAIVVIHDAIQSLMGQSASEPVLKKTREKAESVDGVISVDKLTMIVYGHYYQVMVDIRVDGTLSVDEGHEIARNVKKELEKNKKIGHVIVHVNPEVES